MLNICNSVDLLIFAVFQHLVADCFAFISIYKMCNLNSKNSAAMCVSTNNVVVNKADRDF